MGKMIYGLLLIFIMEVAYMLFLTPATANTSIFDFILNLQSGSITSFWALIINNLGAAAAFLLGVGGIVAGLYAVRYDWVYWMLWAVTFFTFTSVISQYYGYIGSLTFLGDASYFFAAMFGAIMVVTYLMTTLDFARGKD